MLTRRDLFRYGAVTGAAAMLPWKLGIPTARADVDIAQAVDGFQQFVEPLPIPPVQQAVGKIKGIPLYEVPITQFGHWFGFRDSAGTKVDTQVFGYNGRYLGETIVAETNRAIKVRYVNSLPTTHLLPVDTSLHGAINTPAVRSVAHLHGGTVTHDNDGWPEDWAVPGQVQTFDYPNIQRSTLLWYHDHSLGATRLNVYAGMAAAYIIRDSVERRLNIPRAPFEIPLVIQDKSFNADGSLFYPSAPEPDSVEPGFPPIPDPSVVPEFFGDIMLVNGMAWPLLEVEPRMYRLRVLNGCNSRFLGLTFSNSMFFFQIGNEGGLFEKPVMLNRLLLGPAERADLIVNFRHHKGEEIILTNDAQTPFPTGDEVDADTTGRVMKIVVNQKLSCPDKSSIPSRLSCVPRLFAGHARKVRDLTLDETIDEFGRLLQLLNKSAWDDPITEKPKLNTTEVWRLINLTVDTHPIHLHLVHFQVLDRRPFNVQEYISSGNIVWTGPVEGPARNERGAWKDTVQVPPDKVTRIIAKFGPFKGKYPWHCHIVEHEDHDMMRPYEVV